MSYLLNTPTFYDVTFEHLSSNLIGIMPSHRSKYHKNKAPARYICWFLIIGFEYY